MELIKGGRIAEISFFNEKVLENTVKAYPQEDMSAVVTVPHDGSDTVINSGGSTWELPKRPLSKPRDEAVSHLAQDMRKYVSNSYFRAPGMYIEKIHREYLTQQMKRFFNTRVLTGLKHSGPNEVILLDLHGFTKQPQIGEFDLILGTGHRRSVKGTQIDKHFEEFMSDRGYSVYRPESYPIKGELYGAESPEAIINIAQQYSNRTYGLQVEVARHFRESTPESTEKGKTLTKDLGEYLTIWEKGLKADAPLKKTATIYQFPRRNS